MASTSDIPEGTPFDAWRAPLLSAAQFAALAPAGRLAYLTRFAVLAPTTHNTVPQRLRLDARGAHVDFLLDRRFVLAASDRSGRQATVSVGCAIATFEHAATAYGLETEAEYSQTSTAATVPLERDTRRDHDGGYGNGHAPRYVQLARLHLSGEPLGTPEPGLRLLLSRKMVRAEYDSRAPLPPLLAEELRSLCGNREGIGLELVTDAATRLALGKFQQGADSTVLNRDDFARELGDWLHEDSSAEPLGMRGAEFGLAPAAARRFRLGLRREGPLLPDEISAFAKAGAVGMRSASAIAVVTIDEDTTARRLAAGQAYLDCALRLSEHGFSTAMHAGITEVEPASLALRARLRTRARPTVVFRIGQPLHHRDQERPHSSRPALSDVLLSPGSFPGTTAGSVTEVVSGD